MHHSPLAVGLATAILVLSSAAPVAAGTPSPAQNPKRSSPSAVLIGGNLKENAEIIQSIVDLADPDGKGPKRARIAIVSAAASGASTPEEAADPDLNNAAANGLYYSALFARFGADTYAVPIDTAVDYDGDPYTPANAASPAVAAEVAASTGVFFGGGDQMRYVRTLFTCTPAPLEAFRECTDTPVMAAIRTVAARWVVAGVSAGLTIQQGPNMITGGESYPSWRDGSTPGYLDDADALGFLPSGGFGFVDDVLIDSHFTTWGREGRIVKLAIDTHTPLVLGIDETTAVVLDRSSGKGRVIGEQGASLIDVSHAVSTTTGVEGVRWSYANAGDEIDLRRGGKVSEGKGSKRLVAQGAAPAVGSDIWDSIDGDGGEYSLRDLARQVVASKVGVGVGLSFETGPQYATTLVRDRATTAWTTRGGSVSFTGLQMIIDRVG